MLIALSGPSSCGKTTLLQSLYPYQRDFPFTLLTHQYARELLELKGWSVKTHLNNPENIVLFQKELLDYKRSIEEPFFHSQELVITERSFIDLFVFYQLYTLQFPKFHFDLDNYRSTCIELSKQYTSIVYLKNTPVVEDDSIRIVDQQHLQRQQLLFSRIFQTEKFPSFFIVEDTLLSSRKKAIFSLLTLLTPKEI